MKLEDKIMKAFDDGINDQKYLYQVKRDVSDIFKLHKYKKIEKKEPSEYTKPAAKLGNDLHKKVNELCSGEVIMVNKPSPFDTLLKSLSIATKTINATKELSDAVKISKAREKAIKDCKDAIKDINDMYIYDGCGEAIRCEHTELKKIHRHEFNNKGFVTKTITGYQCKECNHILYTQ